VEKIVKSRLDIALKKIGQPLDISEDLNGDGLADSGSLNCEVISVQHLKSRILIGTKGGDIFEAILPKNPAEFPSLTRITSSHSFGEVWGLAVNPVKEEFATSGDDLTIRIWSLRTYEQTKIRVLPHASRAVAYSPTGAVIAIGLVNGAVALMDANSLGLKVFSTWEHSSCPISVLSFSPDGHFLAVGSKDNNVYLYTSSDKKMFRRQGVCCGHIGPITHLDFSSNSQYLRSNSDDMSVYYWDMNGNTIKTISTLRNTTWSTNTCVFSWGSQGVWSSSVDTENNDRSFVTSCMALPDVEDIVCGDISGLIKLYKYPSLESKSLHQCYIGHSSAISVVRFTNNRRFVLSIGGSDRTILIWKHESELSDDSGDDDDATEADDSFPTEYLELIPMPTVRTAVQEASNNLASSAELAVIFKKDNADVVMPWKTATIEPSSANLTTLPSLRTCDPLSSTDVDLNLKWIHGHRCSDIRSNVLYSASGSIVYNAAKVAVVYSRSVGKQRFLQGAHKDDIISIAVDPTGQYFATSEIGHSPDIFVWNVSTMLVVSRLGNCHTIGVPLLAFSKKGNLLASIGQDSNNSICLRD